MVAFTTDRHCIWAFKYLTYAVSLLLWSLADCWVRMTAGELIRLTNALNIPRKIKTSGGHVFSGVEALALLCAQFRSAGNIYELITKYDRSQAAISEIVNYLCCYIDNRWSHLLDFDHTGILSSENLAVYAEAIHNYGAPLDSVWGFIDCTICQMCRPRYWQRAAYNSHKKFHALKFQAIMLVNGLFGHLYGPIEGRRNDNYLLAQSGLLDKCREHAIRPNVPDDAPPEAKYLQLFGDPAYGLSYQIISPFAGIGERTLEEAEWNHKMSRPCMSVENGFSLVVAHWPFLNAFWKLRIYQSPIGRYYRVAVLLTNALTCLHPNTIFECFNVQPPDIEEYFHN